MKPLAFTLGLVLTSMSSSAEVVDVYSEFESQAKEQLELLNNQEGFDRTTFEKNTFRLLSLGREIFRRYSHAYPECREQYLAILDDRDADLIAMNFQEADERYHDAKGLPEGKCYLGRTYFAHSLMALKRFPNEAEYLGSNFDDAKHDLEELLEHLPRTRQRIKDVVGETASF